MKQKDNKLKVILVSSMQPYSNYSRNLAMGLAKEDIELIVYAENIEKTKKIRDCGVVKPLWRKGFLFYIDVFGELVKDRPDVIHLQQEFNMFGGAFLSTIFPLFLLLLKLFRAKKVVTVHAVVEKGLIDRKFVKFFKGDNSNTPPFILKIFFQYFYWFTALLSDRVIVHTKLLRRDLIKSYHVNPRKVGVIPVAAWIRFDKRERKRGDYFYYFGYLVRRKGLKNVVDGFIKFIKETKNKDIKLFLGGGVIKGQEFARDEILELIKKHKLDNQIKYLGFLESDDVEKYLANSYACIVPGVFTIAASGPLSHIFGYGKCALTSNVGYLAEEVEDGVDGFLVDNDKWNEVFAKAVSNPGMIEKIERNVEKKARKRSNVEVAKMHLKVYKA